MALDQELQDRITGLVTSGPVVLFMKGNRGQPQCGFSAQVVQTLDRVLVEYQTFDVLSDMEVREGIKEYSDWPTIPQLYVGGEFQGGCDIVQEMYDNGELHQVLGLDAPGGELPTVEVTEAAAKVFRDAQQQQPGAEVHVGIDARFRHSFGLGPATGKELRIEAGDLALLMDQDSASRANGLVIDAADTPQGAALKIDNPNAPAAPPPPEIPQMSVEELHQLRESGGAHTLIDVRPAEEREMASIEGALALDQLGDLGSLDPQSMIVLHCHHGSRSQAVAQSLASAGFGNVHNLTGGIDAWALEIDPDVARY